MSFTDLKSIDPKSIIIVRGGSEFTTAYTFGLDAFYIKEDFATVADYFGLL